MEHAVRIEVEMRVFLHRSRAALDDEAGVNERTIELQAVKDAAVRKVAKLAARLIDHHRVFSRRSFANNGSMRLAIVLRAEKPAEDDLLARPVGMHDVDVVSGIRFEHRRIRRVGGFEDRLEGFSPVLATRHAPLLRRVFFIPRAGVSHEDAALVLHHLLIVALKRGEAECLAIHERGLDPQRLGGVKQRGEEQQGEGEFHGDNRTNTVRLIDH